MSADNWRECPKCSKKLKDFIDKQSEVGKKGFTEDEWEEFETLKELVKEHDNTPLREDYELGVGEDCLAYVIYSGECQVCFATWSFKKEDIEQEK